MRILRRMVLYFKLEVVALKTMRFKELRAVAVKMRDLGAPEPNPLSAQEARGWLAD
jgi:hypothetical protein